MLQPSRKGTSRRRRVLIVDDSEDSAELVKTILEDLGHETRIARDGPEALQACEEIEPDIVFLDIGLPGMSGHEVVARMRQMPAGATIPIIALSGYDRDYDMPPTGGFSEHLTKPIEPSLLGEMVERRAPVSDVWPTRKHA